MSLYLDISAAVHRRAGLGRYAESLARALVDRVPNELAFFYNAENGIEPLKGLEGAPAHTVALGYKPWRMLVWLGQLTGTGFNRLVPGASLFHATEHLLLPLHRIPTVLTVHDLIFRQLPQHHKRLNRWYLNLTMPLYCRRASHIIAVSEAARRDLMAAYGMPSEKISVIYEAADPRFCPQSAVAVASALARYDLPARYVLFVGTIEPRKNLGRLLAAFERIHREGLSDALVIVGKRGWLTDDFFAALEQSPVREHVIFPGFVPDADLPAVYSGAQALVLPSLCEGFGLPVLEAMACRTPVICSDTSSLPEVGGDAALLVDPTDVDAMAGAITRVLTDSGLNEQMRVQGEAQAAHFSWERAAEETLVVYKQLVHF
jgi:glycosyltransferase involved in cell wall biosynthesis